jgi:putative chitinase
MLLKNGSRGSDVTKLQAKLGLKADGIYGSDTETAVKNWQKANGLTADGIVGNLTWGKLFELGNSRDPDHPVDYSHLAEGDLDDDDGSDIDDPDSQFEVLDSVDLNKLKGHVPDAVIAQIPECITTFNINTRLRLAHFLAQCNHESGGFKFTAENLNYSASGLQKIFPKYFPGDLSDQYARQPDKIASRVYANRMGNGNEASREGWKYRGRGYIQLTGKDNYKAFATSVSDDILANPDLVSTKYPLLSAAWFWNSRSLNDLADKGATDDAVTAITKKVNGGTLGLSDRIKHFNDFYAALA